MFISTYYADGASISARKAEFDAAQLQYLRSQSAVELTVQAQSLIEAVRESYADVAKHLQEHKLDDPYVSVLRVQNAI